MNRLRDRADLFNALALGTALALSVGFGLLVTLGNRGLQTGSSVPTVAEATAVVRDASGVEVPVAAYSRIVSGSTVADQVLRELCNPTQIVAFTRLSQAGRAFGHLYQDRPGIETVRDVEAVMALKPDLVVVSSGGSAEVPERLRRAHLTVFDLGEMRGFESLLSSANVLARLLGVPERAERLARGLRQRAGSIAADIPDAARPRALYVSIIADKIYGGTRGTSFADLLRFAGLEDAAAESFSGWPRYSVEQLLTLDPDVLVTQEGMGAQLCSQSALGMLRVCSGQGRIAELPEQLVNDPGVGLLEAATLLRDKVHGSSAPQTDTHH